jgi:DNA-binding NtrC family response regulator
VFLDEVGELALGTLAKLLRVLEQRTVMRLGSTRERPVDVRFVAATNRDLEAESAAGRFRQDLFFRLNGVSLLIPPLRERPQEIDAFSQLFLATAAREIDRASPPTLSAAAREILRRHRWPGNVRELRNAIGRAVVLCPGDTVLPEHLPPSLLKAVEAQAPAAPPGTPPVAPPRPVSDGATLQSEVDALEKAKILETLERCSGNQTRTAQMLGISRGTLIARLEAFGISRPRKRAGSPDGG